MGWARVNSAQRGRKDGFIIWLSLLGGGGSESADQGSQWARVGKVNGKVGIQKGSTKAALCWTQSCNTF